MNTLQPSPQNEGSAMMSLTLDALSTGAPLARSSDALTGPLEDIASLRFEDLFDLQEIQRIQDAFALATGVASIITNVDGTPITAPSNFCYLCENVIRKTKKGLANCYRSDAALGRVNPTGPSIQPCLSGGLWDGGASIRIGDRHIANWLIGQVLDDSRDQEVMLAYGREIEADPEEFAKALQDITRMSPEQFVKIGNALFLIAGQLSNMALQNAQQARYIAASKQAEELLRQSEANLSAALHVAQMGYWEFDVPTQMFTFNDQYYRLHGTTAQAAGGYRMSAQTFAEKYVHPEDAISVGRSIQQAIAATDPNLQIQSEVRILRADGEPRWVTVWFRIEKNAQGQTVKLHGVNQDITERKQAEKRLQESQQLLQSFLDNFPDGAWVKDVDGHFLLANRYVVENIYGATADQVLGKTVYDTFPPEVADALWGSEKRLLEKGEPFSVEEMIPQADGKTYNKLTTKFPLYDAEGKISGLGGVLIDITERKRLEDELRVASLYTRNLIEASLDPLVTISPDGKVTDVNSATEQVTGVPREQLVGTDFADYFTEPDRARAGYQQVFAQGTVKDYPLTIRHAAGRTTDVLYNASVYQNEAGEVQGVFAAARDVTESKRLEREVQQAFERRGYQVQVSTEISQEVAAASELSELFGRVVVLTKERLGYYHTQLLRYDSTQDAVVLISGYGDIGEKMLASGHKLPMGRGLIGTAAAGGQTILRPVLAEDPDWEPNPLLPETQGEIAVPIKLGEQVLGVLDVQSNQAGTLTEDDRLLLEGLCGQIAVAIEQTRLRQEMAERLEEVNRLYRSMSHEGWKTYRETTDLPAGFIFDQTGLRPVDEEVLADDLFANIPMKVLGGEVVGTLTVANDPLHPTSPEDQAFLQQVSDQIALALESARLSAQTQTALAQSEKLFEASRSLTQAADLQALVKASVETLNIPVINRAVLGIFDYGAEDEFVSMTIAANWWDGTGHEATAVGTSYPVEVFRTVSLFASPVPIFFDDAFIDPRADAATLGLAKRLNLRAVAVLPLYLGTRQVGVLMLEAEDPHNFSQDEIRLFSALAPQIATVLENRRQYERAQQQAKRESTLNIISQKIQSATTVEAVLQIAARELGHALGAPMTIAQLSMKDKK